jgi:hypothetical protein
MTERSSRAKPIASSGAGASSPFRRARTIIAILRGRSPTPSSASMAHATAWPEGDPRSRPVWLGDPRRCASADCALLALAALAATGTLAPGSGLLRPLLVLLAACVVPGAALLTRVEVHDLLEAAGLAVAFSLGVEGAGALAMVWTGWWHPLAWGLTLLAAACSMFLLDLRRVARTAALAGWP